MQFRRAVFTWMQGIIALLMNKTSKDNIRHLRDLFEELGIPLPMDCEDDVDLLEKNLENRTIRHKFVSF